MRYAAEHCAERCPIASMSANLPRLGHDAPAAFKHDHSTAILRASRQTFAERLGFAE